MSPAMHYSLLPRGEMIYLLLFLSVVAAVFVFELRTLLVLALRRRGLVRPASPRMQRLEGCCHGLALFGVLCMAWGYTIEPYAIDVSRTTRQVPGLIRPLRVVHFSDTHCDLTARNESRAVELVRELQPDLLFFTGDSLNTAERLPRFRAMLAAMPAREGKYAVRGNYDCSYWPDLDLFAGTGFHELTAETVRPLDDCPALTLTGLSLARRGKWRELLGRLSTDEVNLFLFHTPELARLVSRYPVDLYLCGHVHGGQVAMPFWGALITFSPLGKAFERGAYDLGRCLIYVNRGLGMEGGWAPRVRFGSRPEITVIDLLPLRQ